MTLLAALLFSREALAKLVEGSAVATAGQLLVVGVIAFLLYGNLVYQFARIGRLKRAGAHGDVPDEEVAGLFDEDAPHVAVLVPSYKEEPSVVRKTLLSAALQDYGPRRVVLLIDDDPEPEHDEDRCLLEGARALPREVGRALVGPRWKAEDAARSFAQRQATGRWDAAAEAQAVGRLCGWLAGWFEKQGTAFDGDDHADRLFVECVLLARARTLREQCRTWFQESVDATADAAAVGRAYRRLVAAFSVELCSFERKRYANLSHEPNKAMNLNSYISLLGRRFVEEDGGGGAEGRILEPARGSGDFSVPGADLIVTLDADSILAPDYLLRLVHVLRQPGYEDVGVIQTPYSAFPGAPSRLERVAGATTDIQYLVHQGYTHHRATFWVGANAVLRKAALDDIMTIDEERGHAVRRYVQDRTVIEDTESTLDLVAAGWRLYNYPARLSYSATPPDFGALVVQRRRWANGGLIVIPKLLRRVCSPSRSRMRLGEALLRLHYLTSIAGVNLGLLVLFALPFQRSVVNGWLPVAATPYFVLYGRDLRQNGYRWRDLLDVYALNLALVPVNCAGVLKSIQQATTGHKIPFARTPKVADRTTISPLYVALEYAIIASLVVVAVVSIAQGHVVHAVLDTVNVGLFIYALCVFVGLRHSLEDLGAARPDRRPAPTPATKPSSESPQPRA